MGMRTIATILALLAAACGPVPGITFADDGGEKPNDAAPSQADDAAAPDAGAAPDASPRNACRIASGDVPCFATRPFTFDDGGASCALTACPSGAPCVFDDAGGICE